MSLNEILNTEWGFVGAIGLTWIAFIWFYRENKKEHEELGKTVKTETGALSGELSASIDRLSDKIDGVRDAISQHESIWHAPKRVGNTTRTEATRRKGATKKK